MAEKLIEVIDVHRSFGDIKAVQGVSFSLERGQTVGFIGSNGAGKTTTMRMLALLDAPERGCIYYDGMNAVEHGARVRARIGWMPDAYGAYEHMTVGEYIDFFARAYGYRGQERQERISEIMAFTELDVLVDRNVDTLSKGMSQRLCLGRALINDPELLILDEPAAGLDPEARLHFKHLVRLMASEGKTLLISSHILSELEDMCDMMLFIDSGKIVHHGSAEVLKRNKTNTTSIDICVAGGVDELYEWLVLQPDVNVKASIKQGYTISIANCNLEQLSQLLRRAISEGLNICRFSEQQRRLEDAFVDIVKGREEVQ